MYKASDRGLLCFIMKPRLYSFDPLKPHFYTLKLGFTGLYINFLFSAQNHRLWVLVRTASSNFFLSESVHVLVVKFSVYFKKRVFVMYTYAAVCKHTKWK